jgi:hypothetical protein
MKKIIFIAALFFILSSCVTKKQQKEQKKETPMDCVAEIISEDILDSVPPRFLITPFFCKGDSNKILVLDVREFKEIYDKDSIKIDFKTFVKKIIKQETVLSLHREHTFFDFSTSSSLKNVFYLDSSIVKEYQEKGFENFMLSYFTEDGSGYTFNDDFDMEENKKSTIFYFLFINNYFISCGDYYRVCNAIDMSMFCEKIKSGLPHENCTRS